MLNSHFRTYFAMCLPLCFNFLFGCFPSTFSTGALEDTAGAPASCILAPDWDFSSFDVPTGKILNFQNTRRHLQGAGTRLERKGTKLWTNRAKNSRQPLESGASPHTHRDTQPQTHTFICTVVWNPWVQGCPQQTPRRPKGNQTGSATRQTLVKIWRNGLEATEPPYRLKGH